MERRSFLKRLGILAGASLIPNWLIPAEPEKKGIGQNPYNFPLTDHVPYNPNGGIEAEINKHKFFASTDVAKGGDGPILIHWKDTSGNNWTVVHNPTWDGPIENYENRRDCQITRLNK